MIKYKNIDTFNLLKTELNNFLNENKGDSIRDKIDDILEKIDEYEGIKIDIDKLLYIEDSDDLIKEIDELKEYFKDFKVIKILNKALQSIDEKKQNLKTKKPVDIISINTYAPIEQKLLDKFDKAGDDNTYITHEQVKRKFKLPGVDDLNKDQDRVLRLPEDGQFLIIGGPGTGKSVVALLRAKKYHKNKDYAFLTFNKVLLNATKQLVDFDLNSFTLDSFLGRVYYSFTEEYIPNIKRQGRKADYALMMEKLESKGIEEESYHIIIDEGQDKPTKYYETLMHFGIENFFIVADQNQQITEDNSSRQELTDLLGLEVEDVIELKENYRNSRPIGLLSNSFFTDPSSPPPELPSKSKPSLGTPILYEYTHYQEAVKLILRESDRDNKNLIGVVVTNDNTRDLYFKTLTTMEINLDNPRPMISTYSSKDNKNTHIEFTYSGIVVLNDKSIKGLEFDIVFVIMDGFKIYNNDKDSMKKRFYVMSSRAIKKLVLLKSDNYNEGVEEILPEDENILIRKRLQNGQ